MIVTALIILYVIWAIAACMEKSNVHQDEAQLSRLALIFMLQNYIFLLLVLIRRLLFSFSWQIPG